MKRAQIWTIGYEQATVAALIAELQAARIEVLADVRALPLSRRPGFSKSALRAAVEEAGMTYLHMKPLGTPAEGRAAARVGNHSAMAKVYEGQLALPEAMVAAAELRQLAAAKRTALLCYERHAADCHRQLLANAELQDFEQIDLMPDTLLP